MNEVSGFALRCDGEGRLVRVIGDSDGFASRFPVGSLFPSFAAPDSRSSALDLLVEARGRGVGWRSGLFLSAGQETRRMDLAATLSEGGLTIIATAGSWPVEGDLDEISKLNNELLDSQRRLAKSNAQLARLDSIKDRFLGMASHDLRNPIGVSLSYAELLAEDSPVSEAERRDWARRIVDKQLYMLALVNDLLDSSAIEAGELRIATRTVDLAALAREAAQAGRILAGKRSVTIRECLPEAACLVSVDPVRMAQVLGNLLSNAVKFSPDGSTVDLSLASSEDRLELAVADRGEGMPKDFLERASLPFGAATVRTARGEKNIGLGLFISRGIIEAHGGRFLVESEPGLGTTVRLTLLRGPSPSAASGGTLP